jgi:hypothetical protein
MCRDWYQFVMCGCVWGFMSICIVRPYELFTPDVFTSAYLNTLWESPYEMYIKCLYVCVKACSDLKVMSEWK